MDFDMLLMIAATQGGGAVPLVAGPELWPQPAFAASTGLTITHSTIGTGAWRPDGGGLLANCFVTSPPTITVGQKYQYSVTVGANPNGDSIRIQVGAGASVTLTNDLPGTFTGTYTVTDASVQQMLVFDSGNGGSATVTAASFKLLS